MGKPIEGAMESILKLPPKEFTPRGVEDVNPPKDSARLENYILLPTKLHGSYSYPESLVAMHRLNYLDSGVHDAAQRLNLVVRNTSKEEKTGLEFMGKILWQEAMKLVLAKGSSALTLRQGLDFLRLLKDGLESRIQVYDGLCRPLQPEILREVYNEIVEVRSPWRGEWLDADYKCINDELWLYSGHTLQGNSLEPLRKEKLLSCFMEKGRKIMLATCNEQGMPVERGNDIYYWCQDKDNHSVAWLGADSGRADLNCNWNPDYCNAELGVREVMRT